jgi:hypothetical protein
MLPAANQLRALHLWCGIGSQPAVEVPVTPLAGPELGRPDDPFELKTGLDQGFLLGQVLRVGTGLDPLRWIRCVGEWLNR